MGKNRKGKRSKKRVQRRARKLRELTAEDLLQNPALLQSPQFQALPLEKQYQLINQMRQLKAAMGGRPMMSAGGSSPSGGVDSAMYHKLNDIINKNSRKDNEYAQMQAQYQAELERLKQHNESLSRLEKEQKRKKKERSMDYMVT